MRLCSLLCLFLFGCLPATQLRGEQPPTNCPNFSGAYRYPGIPGVKSVCSEHWLGQEKMPLPATGGFYHPARRPHNFVVVQAGCRQLTVNFYVDAKEGDFQHSTTLNLYPTTRSQQTMWTEDSLFFKRKFTPAGFRLPGQRRWMEVRFTKMADGSLLYHLILRERKNSKPLNEIECLWPRAGE